MGFFLMNKQNKQEERERQAARRAEALRANLKRRKQVKTAAHKDQDKEKGK